MNKSKFSVLILLFVSVSLAGCSDSNLESSSGADSESTTISFEDIEPASNPDEYAVEKVNQLFNISTNTRALLEEEIFQCMSDKGLAYEKKIIVSSDYNVRDYMLPKPLTLENARSNGYSSESLYLEQNQLPADTSSSMFEALNGTENGDVISVAGVSGKIRSDGCLAKAYTEVYGSPEAGVLIEAGGSSLPIPYLNAAHLDQSLIELDDRWSQCMEKDFSLNFENPDFTNISPESGTIEVAVADATCRETVEYEKNVHQTMNAYLTTFLQDNENIIAEINDIKP